MEWESDDPSEERDTVSPFATPNHTATASTNSALWDSVMSSFHDHHGLHDNFSSFKLDITDSVTEHVYTAHSSRTAATAISFPWGAITETPEPVHPDGADDAYYGYQCYGDDSHYMQMDGRDCCHSHRDEFERRDAVKRLLVFGFTRRVWRDFLQYCGHDFPSSMIPFIVQYISVSDEIDEYSTSIHIVKKKEALYHLRNYRSIELIERTKEWNGGRCFHSFGTDTWTRGAVHQWRMRISGHQENDHKTCILIGIIEEHKVQQFMERNNPLIGAFTSEMDGYGLLTGNWSTYHVDEDGEFLGATNEVELPPSGPISTEIDLTMKIDFTQKGSSSKCGVLKYALNGRSDVFRNHGVAFDDIDVNGSYRLAFGFYLRDKLALYQVV